MNQDAGSFTATPANNSHVEWQVSLLQLTAEEWQSWEPLTPVRMVPIPGPHGHSDRGTVAGTTPIANYLFPNILRASPQWT